MASCDNVIKGHMTLWMGAPNLNHHFAKLTLIGFTLIGLIELVTFVI